SHDYGGKSVVIGREVGPAAFGQALARARADEPASWVAQELIDAPPIDRFLCVETGARRLSLHLDISTYASLIAGVPEGGSVCRGALGCDQEAVVVGGGVGVDEHLSAIRASKDPQECNSMSPQITFKSSEDKAPEAELDSAGKPVPFGPRLCDAVRAPYTPSHGSAPDAMPQPPVGLEDLGSALCLRVVD